MVGFGDVREVSVFVLDGPLFVKLVDDVYKIFEIKICEPCFYL